MDDVSYRCGTTRLVIVFSDDPHDVPAGIDTSLTLSQKNRLNRTPSYSHQNNRQLSRLYPWTAHNRRVVS
jgi:hypothetical protein